ncbi:hypothetical protein D3C77_292780 [compost metagenome]
MFSRLFEHAGQHGLIQIVLTRRSFNELCGRHHPARDPIQIDPEGKGRFARH